MSRRYLGMLCCAGLLAGCPDGDTASGAATGVDAASSEGDIVIRVDETFVDRDTGAADAAAEDAGSGDTAAPDDTPIPHDDAGAPDASDDAGADTTAVEPTDAEISTDVEAPDGSGGTGGDGAEAPPTCTADAECKDGLDCTADRCESGHCVWTLTEGACLINNVCRAPGAHRPGAPCEVCDPPTSPTAWTPAPTGTSCDDGNACTGAGQCQAGACAVTAIDCADQDDCTADGCDPASGCTHGPLGPEVQCDDGSACTTDDRCGADGCAGKVVDCEDGNPCTADPCDQTAGCGAHPPAPGPCEDGDACTFGDACQGGQCVAGDPNPCDDGNACTIDACYTGFGCVNLPNESPCCQGLTSICDDQDPCTTDLCDAQTLGCSYEHNTGPCDDGTACTVGDTCSDGECVAETLSCDDGNPCTSDACDPASGCVHGPVSGGACDDGIECTTGDTCVAGECVGDDSGCVCTPVFDEHLAKLTTMAIGAGGGAGTGLDVDQNPSTCAPSPGCADGVDNAFAPLAGIVADPIQKALASGSLMFLFELGTLADGPFQMTLLDAKLDPANAGCDIQTTACDYLVKPGVLDAETCEPLFGLPAVLTGQSIVAGSPTTSIPFSIPLADGAALTVQLRMVRFEGTVTLQGGKVTGIQGMLGGAIPQSELSKAIDALPPDGLPLPKDAIKSLLATLVPTDMDADNNGTKESSSISLLVTGVAAHVTGVVP